MYISENQPPESFRTKSYSESIKHLSTVTISSVSCISIIFDLADYFGGNCVFYSKGIRRKKAVH